MYNWNKIKAKIFGLKYVGYIGSADIFASGLSAIFWFYLASIINTDSYGELNYFIGIAAISQVISSVGTTNANMVYSAKNVKIQSTLFLIGLLGGFLSSLVILSIFSRIDIVLLIFAFIIADLATSTILGRKSYSNYFKLILSQKIILIILGISFYQIFGIESVLYAIAFSYMPFTIIIYREFKNTKIDFSLFKSHSAFIINNYVINLISSLRRDIDKLIIPPLFGFAILGNYALALQFYAILVIIPNIFFKYLLPQDASGNINKKLKQIVFLISIGIATIGITIVPMLIPIFFSKFTQAVTAFQILSLAVIPATVSLLYTSSILATEKSRFLLIAVIIQLVTILIGIPVLGSILEITGIAISFVLSSVFNAITLLISKHFFIKR